jgi:hypothetical protein
MSVTSVCPIANCDRVETDAMVRDAAYTHEFSI